MFMEKEPIINCHTHIFTADHVPPFLAKTYVPTPFHFFIPLRPIVSFFRFWYKYPAKLPYSVFFKSLVKFKSAVFAFFTKLFPLNIIAGYYISIYTFFILYKYFIPIFPPKEGAISNFFYRAYLFLKPILPPIKSNFLNVLIVVVVLLFFETIKNFIFFLAKLLWKALSKLPGKQSKEMIQRYLNIGRYAFHKEQKTILSKLKSQYPHDTSFVILPMDMDYMDAGECKTRYRDQMEKLAELKNMPSNKNSVHPFVFADPRRIVKVEQEKRYEPGDKEYFNWTIQNDKIVLGDCFLKEYLETYRFAGIKIYPALGYFPFDEKLLPLWKYASDNDIPIMTHCIKGVIFYRGLKKQEWNTHPVFKQAMQQEDKNNDEDGFKDDNQLESEGTVTEYIPLVLPELKNVDFSYNFTHPLNYLCLLDEELLRSLITAAKENNPNTTLVELFGYSDPETELKHNLKNLKICLAHFGGDDEWKRYFEKDRYNYSSQLAKHPDTGIKFFKNTKNDAAPGKPEQIWKFTDWYSIICSMMLQFPNIYADISYILHNDQEILPLLKQTLQNPRLKEKVLYGTDFFVVRNHKSDKNMLADMMGGLSEEEFDQIARVNPKKYLKRH